MMKSEFEEASLHMGGVDRLLVAHHTTPSVRAHINRITPVGGEVKSRTDLDSVLHASKVYVSCANI